MKDKRLMTVEDLRTYESRLMRGYGVFQAFFVGGILNYTTFARMNLASSIIDDFQRGGLEDYICASAKILWGSMTTLVTLDGLYDIIRGKRHHELFGTIIIGLHKGITLMNKE